MLHVRIAGFPHGVVVDVDDVVEHPHRRGNGLLEFVVGETLKLDHDKLKKTKPRLQTAISWSLVLSVISVQRFELCTTPTSCWGERRLQGSLKVIHGCPVSKSIDSILRHSCVAAIFLYSFSSPFVTFSS